jgi:hypothetical protein
MENNRINEAREKLPANESQSSAQDPIAPFYALLACLIEMSISMQECTVAATLFSSAAASDQAKYNEKQNSPNGYSDNLWHAMKALKDAPKEKLQELQSAFAFAQAKVNAMNSNLGIVTQNAQNLAKSTASAMEQIERNLQGPLSASQFWASLLRS